MIISSQSYVRVHREVKDEQQHYIEIIEELMLYRDKIITGSHQFFLKDVLDMSYKPLSQNGGFLYLHTIQGVFSYNVKFAPDDFIEQYKMLR
ncbi:hypothetical protein JOC78_002852 [Bacillus ectoiniformans]|nr:hypothetical protein [Bacillus ectoiniformans]